MIMSFGDTSKILKKEVSQRFLKNSIYSYQEVKDKLGELYKQCNISRVAKTSDIIDMIKVKQIRIENKRYIQIL